MMFWIFWVHWGKSCWGTPVKELKKQQVRPVNIILYSNSSSCGPSILLPKACQANSSAPGLPAGGPAHWASAKTLCALHILLSTTDPMETPLLGATAQQLQLISPTSALYQYVPVLQGKLIWVFPVSACNYPCLPYHIYYMHCITPKSVLQRLQSSLFSFQ